MKISPSTRLLEDAQLLLKSLRPLPRPIDNPVFIALSGLPGTGKSYFSKKLAERWPLVIFESDVLRKILFPQPDYSWRESARLFRACNFLIEELLLKGVSVILDATNLSERYRKKLYAIASRVDVKFILVKLEAPPGVVRDRLESRMKDPQNRSDAGWEIYMAMRSREEKIRRKHFVVNTTKDIMPVINGILQKIKD